MNDRLCYHFSDLFQMFINKYILTCMHWNAVWCEQNNDDLQRYYSVIKGGTKHGGCNTIYNLDMVSMTWLFSAIYLSVVWWWRRRWWSWVCVSWNIAKIHTLHCSWYYDLPHKPFSSTTAISPNSINLTMSFILQASWTAPSLSRSKNKSHEKLLWAPC